MSKDARVAGDNPIRIPEDDTLGRAVPARFFAQQVRRLDASEGVVVAVLGAWGSGKTSFINLARAEFDGAGVSLLDFNPWMFSGAQQLVEWFFAELAAQLKLRPGLAEIGKDLEEYGEALSGLAWVPVVGPWIDRARLLAKIVTKTLQRRAGSIGERRSKLRNALKDLDKPILVVLDDIDRLSTSEIRDVFKLVRLTASFPNVIYIVAFDRSRVEQALADEGVPGRDYLEKILQVAIDLPAIPTDVLNRQIFAALDASLGTVDNLGTLDRDVWPDVFMEIIRPLMRNMRDVRRYAAAAQGTVAALNGDIALADMLALEAVRVFLPDVFARLAGAVSGLTTTSRDHHESPELKAQVNGLLEAAGPHRGAVRALIERLFPAGLRHIGGSNYGPDWRGGWLRERRVAHEDILRLYLERVASEGLQAFRDAEHAWMRMADRDALDSYLRSLDAGRIQDVIGSLEVYEGQFRAEHVVPGTIVLVNLLPDLPERVRGMFDLDTRLVVMRVTYRLLRSLGSAASVEVAVSRILPELRLLSGKHEVIGIVGHREGRGQLVPPTTAAALERAWRNEVRSRSVAELANDTALIWVLLATKREADPSEPPLMIEDAPELTLAILRSARTEVRRQAMGSRTVHRLPRLAWEALNDLYGDEGILRQRIEHLKVASIEHSDDLIALAERYLGGWRPGHFDDDDD